MNRTSPNFEIRENRREVAFELDQRAGRGAKMRAHFIGDDGSQSRFAEARRAIQQNVIERFAAFPRGLDRDVEVVFDVLLADVLREKARPKRQLERRFFLDYRRSGNHAILTSESASRYYPSSESGAYV